MESRENADMSDAAAAEPAPEAPVSEPQTETASLPEPENALSPAPEAEPEAPFEPKVGDLVEAKWKGGKEWFPAKITAWYPPKTKARDPHYDVEHEDGATQEQLRVDEIRALAPAANPTCSRNTSPVSASISACPLKAKRWSCSRSFFTSISFLGPSENLFFSAWIG